MGLFSRAKKSDPAPESGQATAPAGLVAALKASGAGPEAVVAMGLASTPAEAQRLWDSATSDDPRDRLPAQVIEIADRGLEARNATLASLTDEAGLTQAGQWNVDLATGDFVWEGTRGNVVCADVQVLGTRSGTSNTWLWGWANESLPAERVTASTAIREFGESGGVTVLTEPGCPCKEDQPWAFCNLAIGLGLGSFVYKGNSGPTEVYLLLPVPSVVPN